MPTKKSLDADTPGTPDPSSAPDPSSTATTPVPAPTEASIEVLDKPSPVTPSSAVAALRSVMDNPPPFRDQMVDEPDAVYQLAKDDYLKTLRAEHIANASKAESEAADEAARHPYRYAAGYFASPAALVDALAEHIRTTHGLAPDKAMLVRVHDFLAYQLGPRQEAGADDPAQAVTAMAV